MRTDYRQPPEWQQKATSVMSSTDQSTPSVEELLGYCDALELEPNTQNLRHINQAMMKNPDFFIPKPTYDFLKEMMPAEQFKEFLTKKLPLEKASRSSLKTTSNTYEGRPNENIPPVAPRQYQKSATANLAMLDESGSEDSDDSDDSDDENQELKQARAAMATLSGLYRSACMV